MNFYTIGTANPQKTAIASKADQSRTLHASTNTLTGVSSSNRKVSCTANKPVFEYYFGSVSENQEQLA